MEPLNCTVRISRDKCEIWTGTQFQTVDQQVAAKITGLKPEQVEIHTTFLGGGFGRRATPTSDFVSEAVQVAKAARAPVKTVWTREDDMHGGYYRPAYVHRARIGLGSDGMPTAWHHVIVGQSIIDRHAVRGRSWSRTASTPPRSRAWPIRPTSSRSPTTGWISHSPRLGVPVLWWRSVGHSHTAFVMESLIDELAQAAGKDPVEYRRALLKDHPRHLARAQPGGREGRLGHAGCRKGRARGIAVHESFGSFVAQVAEVSVEKDAIRVHRVVCAIDCGVAVNPETVRAQMESGIAFGLGAALYSDADLQGRPGAAVQLPRLPGAAAERDAGGRSAHRAEHRQDGRRGRAGYAADRAGGGQRGGRADRPAAAGAAAPAAATA